MPLMTSGPFHCSRTHSTSFQVTLASKLRADPAHQVGQRGARAEQRFEIAHGQRPPVNGDVPRPVGPPQHLPQPAARPRIDPDRPAR